MKPLFISCCMAGWLMFLTAAPASADCADRWPCRWHDEMAEFKRSAVDHALRDAGRAAQTDAFMRRQLNFAREWAANQAIDGLVAAADAGGKRLFGRHFRLVSDLSHSTGQGITGDWDAVIPLGVAAQPGGRRAAFFLQSGASHYRANGSSRRDNRYGGVWRFAASQAPGADIFGAWAFMQSSAEYGHQRLHFGGDYTAGRAQLSLDYFLPLTDWRAARFGHQERALEIGTVALRYAPARGLTLGAGLSRRQDADGGRGFSTSGLLDLAWRPPQRAFSLNSAVTGIGGDMALGFTFTLPLGAPRRDSAPRRHASALTDLYRPVASGKIEVAEREAPDSSGVQVGGARVSFLQSSAGTGSRIQLQAKLPAAALQDTRIVVKLAPGDGPHPAVPGVDYKDAPIELLIRAGETTATATVMLINNPGMTAGRSLRIAVHSS